MFYDSRGNDDRCNPSRDNQLRRLRDTPSSSREHKHTIGLLADNGKNTTGHRNNTVAPSEVAAGEIAPFNSRFVRECLSVTRRKSNNIQTTT